MLNCQPPVYCSPQIRKEANNERKESKQRDCSEGEGSFCWDGSLQEELAGHSSDRRRGELPTCKKAKAILGDPILLNF